ncbi:hypothetical protein FDECE_17703 [Fusarium decemcellulare]|nr:hypothetical protein FDECE_17703 [Fusarium decemcellulare]
MQTKSLSVQDKSTDFDSHAENLPSVSPAPLSMKTSHSLCGTVNAILELNNNNSKTLILRLTHSATRLGNVASTTHPPQPVPPSIPRSLWQSDLVEQREQLLNPGLVGAQFDDFWIFVLGIVICQLEQFAVLCFGNFSDWSWLCRLLEQFDKGVIAE